jgi:hypothetical protein
MSLPTPLPTLCGVFQRLCQRLFQLSANGYQPPFQPCVTNPSYSPCGWKHRFWALGPAVLPPREGKEGGGGKDLVIPNTQITFTPVMGWLGIYHCWRTRITRYCGGDHCADVGTRAGTLVGRYAPQPSEIVCTSVVAAPVCAFGATSPAWQSLGAARADSNLQPRFSNRPPEKDLAYGWVGQAQIAELEYLHPHSLTRLRFKNLLPLCNKDRGVFSGAARRKNFRTGGHGGL